MKHRFDPSHFYIDRHGGWYWGPHVFTLIVFAVLIALAVWLVMSSRKHHTVQHPMMPIAPPPPAMDPALQEARMRYARGELSREDYLRIAEDLAGPRAPDGS
jgi:putative membrane protein